MNIQKNHYITPDVFIVCKSDIDSMKGESYTTPPKVIFEVVSPGREVVRRDKQLKYNIVEQNGFIHQHKLINGEYKTIDTFKNNDDYVSTIFPEIKINLKDIF